MASTILLVLSLLLVLVGIALSFAGGILRYVKRERLAERSTIMSAPTTRIADAPGTMAIEIQGRTAVSEQGTLPSPLTGNLVLAYEIRISALEANGSLREIHVEADSRELYVDDDSGQRARLFPRNALLNTDSQIIATDSEIHDGGSSSDRVVTDTMREWVGKKTGQSPERIQLEECLLHADQQIYALGPSMRVPTSDEPGGELALLSRGGERLRISLCSEKDRIVDTKATIVGIWVLLGTGALLTLAGVATGLLSALAFGD